jgi:large subunit ribosomal protein L9
MANTEVLLLKPLDNLGAEGDQIKVRAGYARNYLFPKKLATPLTQANRKHVEVLKKRRADREVLELKGAQEIARKLEKVSLAFAVKTGEGGKMFGAITATDLHKKLEEAGILIDKRKIHLHTPAKTLGKHETKIRLHSDVSVDITFDIVSENPIEPTKEEAAAAAEKTRRTEKKSTHSKTHAAEEHAHEAAAAAAGKAEKSEKSARPPRAKKPAKSE